jgi:hypothetical protein
VTYEVPRGRIRMRSAFEGVLVVLGVIVVWRQSAHSIFALLLLASIVVIAWSFVTLHAPTRIVIGDDAIELHSRGRFHRFLWANVTRIDVRRFATRDRILLRMWPSNAISGRYWIDRSMEGFDALEADLQRRIKPTSADSPASRSSLCLPK